MFPACWRCKTTQLATETRPEAEEATGDVSVEHDGKIGTSITGLLIAFSPFFFSLFKKKKKNIHKETSF